jgi:hypothetical protein
VFPPLTTGCRTIVRSMQNASRPIQTSTSTAGTRRSGQSRAKTWREAPNYRGTIDLAVRSGAQILEHIFGGVCSQFPARVLGMGIRPSELASCVGKDCGLSHWRNIMLPSRMGDCVLRQLPPHRTSALMVSVRFFSWTVVECAVERAGSCGLPSSRSRSRGRGTWCCPPHQHHGVLGLS